MLWAGADYAALGLEGALFVDRPRAAMAPLTAMLDSGPAIAHGTHPSALIDPTAQIGPGASIGPFAVIGARVTIGASARIGAHVSIRENAFIGADALLMDGARIGARVRIGDRFICHSGAVIGADGFSFTTPETNRVEAARATLGDGSGGMGQRWKRIHSLGGVIIGDDVEVGANSCVDRGTIRATRIGRGTKIDNLVHVAHNVTVGEDCLLCALVGIAGSTRIGNRVVLGGQVGVTDNTEVGDDVVAGGGSTILNRIPSGRVVLGTPAIRMEDEIAGSKNVRRLPRLFAQVAELRKRLSDDGASD